jgi:hypothetical protein
MKQVYVLQIDTYDEEEYEGTYIKGIYSTWDLAIKVGNSLNLPDDEWCILEYELDELKIINY